MRLLDFPAVVDISWWLKPSILNTTAVSVADCCAIFPDEVEYAYYIPMLFGKVHHWWDCVYQTNKGAFKDGLDFFFNPPAQNRMGCDFVAEAEQVIPQVELAHSPSLSGFGLEMN